MIAPVEPGLIILYNLFQLLKFISQGDLPLIFRVRRVLNMQMFFIFLYSSLPLMLGIFYSILVIVWIVFHIQGNADMDFVYSVAVYIGWMYTIAFTRGIRTIHYFWRMIQSMIVKDIFKFLFIYLFVLLAFSFAFHAMFQISTTVVKTYPSPLDSASLT